ncbi:MAG: sulfur carrier protein ThiS [Phycisphaerales bacterium]|nr:sulfur carrier protein ThiS [Phycisphaerales bacterium]
MSPSMQIHINGEPQTLDGALTVADLLARFELAPQRVAVEINEELAPRASFAERRLADGDRVEIVTFVGGG